MKNLTLLMSAVFAIGIVSVPAISSGEVDSITRATVYTVPKKTVPYQKKQTNRQAQPRQNAQNN